MHRVERFLRMLCVVSSVTVVLVNDVAAQQRRAALLKQADIIFVGTVTKIGATSFVGVPVSPRTMVVRVDGVLDKPAAVALATDDLVTVEAQEPASFREGMQATFYGTGWIFGGGVAVREIGHELAAGPLQAAALSQQAESARDARRQMNDAELRACIRAADKVVVGRVESVAAATLSMGAPRRVTEHDPQWQEATIRVETAIKGAERGQRIVVRFPGSLDKAWYGVPKLTVGQEGTFLLKKDEVSGSPLAMIAGQQVTAYTAMSPQDVLPKQEAARVRALFRPDD